MSDSNDSGETKSVSSIRLESFIFKNFSKMPGWVRIIVYFAIVSVYIYQIVAPKYIGGNIQFKDAKNNLWAYPGQPITYYIQGNSYEVRTTSKGDWALPISGGLNPVYINVYNAESGGYIGYSISILDILNNTFRNKPLFLLMEENEIKENASMRFSKLKSSDIVDTIMDLIPSAPLYGQELKLHEDIHGVKPKSSDLVKIEKKVNDILKDYHDLEVVDGKELHLEDDLELNEFQLLVLYNLTTEEFDLDIPIDHWKKFKTNVDISKYIFSRLQIKEYIDEKDIKAEDDYISQVKVLPEEMRPEF